jgi:hypothetical protein
VIPVTTDEITPEELRNTPQWLCWKNINKGGDKPVKVPFNPLDGQPAKTNDKNTWTTYENAKKKSAKYDGVGFVFTENDPYTGVDLDDCIVGGQITPEAMRIIESINSYSEISPSGNGVKIFCRAKKPARSGSKKAMVGFKSIEVYDQGRYFTLTHKHVAGTPLVVNDSQEAITRICVEHLGAVLNETLPKKYDSESMVLMTYDESTICSALTSISSDDYDTWIRIGMALKRSTTQGLSDERAFVLWDEWSAKSKKYHEGEPAQKWKTFPTSIDDNSVTVGTIIHLAKQNGWKQLDSASVMYESNDGDTRWTNSLEVDGEEEETHIDIAESKCHLDFDHFTKRLLNTQHLLLYDLFEDDLGLQGDGYRAFLKGLWYFEHSCMQDTEVVRVNRRVKADNRFHLLCITAPSGGKSTTKNQIKRIMGGDDVSEVSGISSPEQLVGKVRYVGPAKAKVPETLPGIMSYKVVLYDEAQELLNESSEVYARSQRIKRIAMDTYEENEMSKKLVDDSKTDALRYFSVSRVCDFAHPVKLKSPFFDTGSFRRYNVFVLAHDSRIDVDSITNLKLDSWQDTTISYASSLRVEYDDPFRKEQQKLPVLFGQDVLDVISHHHKCLLVCLLQHKNKNAFRYGLMRRYDLRNAFLKNIIILARSKKEATIGIQTALEACRDTMLFVFKSIEAVNELGNMGIASDVWGGLAEQDAMAIEWLWRKKATSLDSSRVTIKKFWTVLANLYGCRNTQSRAHYYRLKRDGFIDSKQSGTHVSTVWLKWVPKELDVVVDGWDPLAFWGRFQEGVGAENGVPTPSFGSFIDERCGGKVQGVGGVGVLGCIFHNEYTKTYTRHITRPLKFSFSSLYSNNNSPISSNNGVGCPASPTPSQFNAVSPSINRVSVGVKLGEMVPTPCDNGIVLPIENNSFFAIVPKSVGVGPAKATQTHSAQEHSAQEVSPENITKLVTNTEPCPADLDNDILAHYPVHKHERVLTTIRDMMTKGDLYEQERNKIRVLR